MALTHLWHEAIEVGVGVVIGMVLMWWWRA